MVTSEHPRISVPPLIRGGLLLCLLAALPLRAQDGASPALEPLKPAQSVAELDRLLDALRATPKELFAARARQHEERRKQLADRLKAIEDEREKLRAEAERLNAALKALEAEEAFLSDVSPSLGIASAKAEAVAPGKVDPPPAGPMPQAEPKAEPAAKDGGQEAKAKPPVSATEPVAAPPANAANPAPPAKKIAEEKPAAKGPRFEEDILPILEEHCAACHEPAESKGGLDLTSLAAILSGGSSGAVIKAGSAENSRLFRLANHDEEPKMPPGSSKIPAAALSALKAWIDQSPELKSDEGEDTPQKAAPATPDPKKEKAEAEAQSIAATPPLPEAGALAPTDGGVLSSRRALAASDVAPLIATNGAPGEILLIAADGSQLYGALPFPFGRVEALSFSRDGERLLAAGGQPGKRGGAVLYAVRTGEVLARFSRFYDALTAAAISPGQSLIALSGANKGPQVFARDTGALQYAITGHDDWVLCIAVSPDGNWIATGDRRGRVLVHEADTGILMHRFEAHDGGVRALAYSGDATLLVTAGKDGRIATWDAVNAEKKRDWRVPSPVLRVALSADDEAIGCTLEDGSLRWFNYAGGSLGKTQTLSDWGQALCYSKHDQMWIVGSVDGRWRRFAAKTYKEVPVTAP